MDSDASASCLAWKHVHQQSYTIISHSEASNHACKLERANAIPEYQTNIPQNLVVNIHNFENQEIASIPTANTVNTEILVAVQVPPN